MAKHLKLDTWKKEILAGNLCPYCNDLTKRIKGSEIYGEDTPWADLDFMLCRPCWAYTGVHQKSGIALGSVANALLQQHRQRGAGCHRALGTHASFGQAQVKRVVSAPRQFAVHRNQVLHTTDLARQHDLARLHAHVLRSAAVSNSIAWA